MAAMTLGGMAAIITAWLTMGLPVPATREYVDAQVSILHIADEKTLATIHVLQLDVLVSRRDRVEEDIFTQEQALKKNSADFDASRRLRMLQDQLMELNESITRLRGGGN